MGLKAKMASKASESKKGRRFLRRKKKKSRKSKYSRVLSNFIPKVLTPNRDRIGVRRSGYPQG